jgi:hypothetical protein
MSRSQTGVTCSIGTYLAKRYEQIGIRHQFAVAGDYNLVLLDQLLLNKNLHWVYSIAPFLLRVMPPLIARPS